MEKKSFDDFIKNEKFVLPKEGRFSSTKRERSLNLTFVILTFIALCFTILFVFITTNCYKEIAYNPKVQGQTVSAFVQGLASESVEKININTASLKKLREIKYIGEVRAELIIIYRTKNNGFKSVDEIKNINGISDKIFEEIKDSICV